MNPTRYQHILGICSSHPSVKAEIDKRAINFYCTDIHISVTGRDPSFTQYRIDFYYQLKKGSPFKHSDFTVIVHESKKNVGYKVVEIIKI